MKSLSIIITAGGSGKRMNASLPKQFLELLGRPVLFHTIERLYHIFPNAQLLLTLPQNQVDRWNELVKSYGFAIDHVVITGGDERYHSVKNALASCTGDVIAVHDGVRPLFSRDVALELYALAQDNASVIPVIPVKESLRRLNGESSHAIDRSEYRAVQTPQFFHAQTLKAAYNLPYSSDITDDASLVEKTGVLPVHVDGNPENIKITYPVDLRMAEFLLS